jgi:hypothetical protein
MIRNAKVDANQKAIVAALRQIGCAVISLAPMGRGCPDLLVARHNCGNILLEVKDGKKPPSRRQLTPDELAFHGSWPGPIAVVDSVESAIRAIVGLTR